MATRKTRAKIVKQKCLVPACDNIAQSRGLCWGCLKTAKEWIGDDNESKAKESILISRRLLLPIKKLGRPRSTAMARVLARKTK